jgi:mono/diheme cytochrome c family protein
MSRLPYFLACAVLGASAAFASAKESGADIYKTNCALCHGENGDGDTPPGKALKAASFSSPDVVKKTDAELLSFTKKGKGQMPPWNGVLTDDQLMKVIAYIRTLQKAPADAATGPASTDSK